MVVSRTISSQTSGAAIPPSGCASDAPYCSREPFADRDQVVAAVLQPARHLVGELGFIERRADRLEVAPVRRPGERGDLRAGVVDVVFLGDVVARLAQQVGQRVAHHRATAMADMHRPRWVGRDILDVDARAVADAAVAVRLAGTQDARQHGAEQRGVEREVHEAGARGAHLRHARFPLQMFDDGGCKFRRRLARGLRRDHGRVGRHVAVRRIARRRHLDARRNVIGNIADDGPQRREHGAAQLCVDVTAHVGFLITTHVVARRRADEAISMALSRDRGACFVGSGASQ